MSKPDNPRIHFLQVVTNDNGGTKTFTDFSFAVAGPTASSGNFFDGQWRATEAAC